MDRRVPMIAGIAFAMLYAAALLAVPTLPGIDKPVIVVLNKSDRPTDLDVPVYGLYSDANTLSDQRSSFQGRVVGGKVHVPLFPRDGVILVGTS